MKRSARILRSKTVLSLAILAPLFSLAYPISQGSTEYFADPAKYLLEYIGKSATILYIIVTGTAALRSIFPRSALTGALLYRRRQLGIAVFAYALLHFLIYCVYIGDWATFVDEWNKLFILSGFAALLLLAILAATSNNRSLRKLGFQRWKKLHRLTHVVMFLLIYHQAAQEKYGYRETAAYYAPLFVLQGIRFVKIRRETALKAQQAET